MGWVTVLVYLSVAALSLAVALRAPFPARTRRKERRFWALLAAVLLLLAVNKQLDVQSCVTALGQCLAREQGWYKSRRLVQMTVIFGLVLAMLGFALGLGRVMRGTRNRLALIGLVAVLGFVAIRAMGFHPVDALIGADALHLRLHWLFELSGPVLILLAALRLLDRPP